MTDITMRRWKEAADIAYRAMGTRGKDHIHVADEDPLAWWCLTEWIYNYGQRALRSSLTGAAK